MKNKISAFTLIETILYLALFGIIFSAIISFTLSVAESNQYALLKNEIEHTAIFVDEHFTKTFEEMNEIDTDNTIFDQNNGHLYLKNPTSSTNYRINDNRLTINRDGLSNSLTNQNIKMDKFLVQKVLSPDLSISGVRITFNIYSTKRTTISKEFQAYYSIK